MSNGSATVTMEESPDAAVVVRLAHPYRLIEWDSMLERVLGAELAADAIAAAGLWTPGWTAPYVRRAGSHITQLVSPPSISRMGWTSVSGAIRFRWLG